MDAEEHKLPDEEPIESPQSTAEAHAGDAPAEDAPDSTAPDVAATFTEDETLTLDTPDDAVEAVASTEAQALAGDEEPASTAPDTGDETPDEAPGPVSAAPPRVLAETPVGGVLKAPAALPPEADTSHEQVAEPPAEPDTPHVEAAPEPEEDTEPPAPEIAGDAETERDELPHERTATEASVAEDALPEDSEDSEELVAEQAPSFVRTLETLPESEGVAEETGPPPDTLKTPKEWEGDLSPELAAVLFSSPRSEAAQEAPAIDRPLASATEAAVVTPPVAEEPPAGPILLKEPGDARTLRITAQGRSAPAPEAAIAGKVRYTRVEEPLKNDAGQRVTERWVYFKPDYPALEGRLVREVRSEEISYSDGSWLWRYERRYADRGRDRREVRANADRTYLERVDEVSKLDPESGKRQQLKEEAAMIFAPPIREEKRGLLASLLGRDNDEPAGEDVWREATPSDMKQARKDGGQAFKRGFLASLFR